jgi:hypothetical protein
MREFLRVERMAGYGLILVGVLMVGAAVQAAETVVQNDDLMDFQQAVVVGDFVAGERAGVRLTSPCDGEIVAVQVLWWEGVPGNPGSLEEAITIHADQGLFPMPGLELLLLEAPFMTPGFLNEFRYTDENNTVPISVPVTNGQNFFVVFEFANPTDVGLPTGGPSVVRDVTGCQATRNVLYGNIGLGLNWYDFCLLTTGDFVIRAVVDCDEPTGACCDFEANCTNDVESGDCQEPGDTFNQGLTCAQVSCPQPTGACCNGIGGCLDTIEQIACEETFSGIYAGNGTVCADQVCAVGACCLPDGSCQDVVDVACTGQGGIFEGAGTTCAGTSCPQPLGACCIGTACVPNQTEVNCVGFPGVWQGAFTDCGPPNPCSLCNDGDADQDGDVDLDDFAVMQGCYGSAGTGPCECMDMDNSGTVDAGDVAQFVSGLAGP